MSPRPFVARYIAPLTLLLPPFYLVLYPSPLRCSRLSTFLAGWSPAPTSSSDAVSSSGAGLWRGHPLMPGLFLVPWQGMFPQHSFFSFSLFCHLQRLICCPLSSLITRRFRFWAGCWITFSLRCRGRHDTGILLVFGLGMSPHALLIFLFVLHCFNYVWHSKRVTHSLCSSRQHISLAYCSAALPNSCRGQDRQDAIQFCGKVRHPTCFFA